MAPIESPWFRPLSPERPAKRKPTFSIRTSKGVQADPAASMTSQFVYIRVRMAQIQTTETNQPPVSQQSWAR